MNKMVWRDYWKGFAWSNIKAYLKENKSFVFVCIVMCFVTLPNHINEEAMGREELIRSILKAWALLLPIVFTFVSLQLTSISFPRVLFYMSPMTVEERREFLVKKWRLAVVVPAVFNAIWMLLGLFVGMDVRTAVFFTVHMILLTEGLAVYGCKNAKQWEKTQDKSYTVYGIILVIVGIIVHAVAAYVVGEYGMLSITWLAILTGVMVLLELPLLYKLMTYKKKLIANMLNYESVHDVGR